MVPEEDMKRFQVDSGWRKTLAARGYHRNAEGLLMHCASLGGLDILNASTHNQLPMVAVGGIFKTETVGSQAENGVGFVRIDNNSKENVVQVKSLPPFKLVDEPLSISWRDNLLLSSHCNGIVSLYDVDISKIESEEVENEVIDDESISTTTTTKQKYRNRNQNLKVRSEYGTSKRNSPWIYQNVINELDTNKINYGNSPSSSSSSNIRETGMSFGGNSDEKIPLSSFVQRKLSSGYFNYVPSLIPGKVAISSRINLVRSCPVDNSIFLTMENHRINIWDFDCTKNSIAEISVSSCPLLAACWSPHDGGQSIMAGGFSKTMTMIDLRLIDASYASSSSPNRFSDCPWKVENAHIAPISSLSWHPFVPYWVVSGGMDGITKIWDLRYGAFPARVFREHISTINTLEWSPFHAENLITGGSDCTSKLWNIQNDPHYLLFSRKGMRGVVHSGFLPTPNDVTQAFALTRKGELMFFQMNPSFFEPFIKLNSKFIHHNQKHLYEIEKKIYLRDIASAFEKAIKFAQEFYDNGEFAKCLDILHMFYQRGSENVPEYVVVGENGVAKTTAKLVASSLNEFNAQLKNYSYFMPPGYQEKHGNQIDPKYNETVEILRLKAELGYFMETNKFENLLSRLPEVIDLAVQDVSTISVNILKDAIIHVMKGDYLRALEFTIEMAHIFQSSGKYSEFAAIPMIFLFPSIYDGANDAIIEKNPKLNSFIYDFGRITRQLIFMKQFLTISWNNGGLSANKRAEELSILVNDFSEVPVSVPFFRLVLSFLLFSHNFDQYFARVTSMKVEVDGFLFLKKINSFYDMGISSFHSHVNNLLVEENRIACLAMDYEGMIVSVLRIIRYPGTIPDTFVNELPLILRNISGKYRSILNLLCTHPNPNEPLSGKGQSMKKVENLKRIIEDIPEDHENSPFYSERETLVESLERFIF